MELKMLNERRRTGYAARRLAEFATRCREGGLAVTPQRLAIIRALLASVEHPRADTVYEIVRREHPYISLATVHRTLETLCEIGEARKVTTLHDSARYDGNLAPHHHVVCVKCRRVRDIEIPELEQVLKGRAAIGDFQLIGSSLEVQALCSQCAAGRTTKKNRKSTKTEKSGENYGKTKRN
jgi:Fur family transcriptional regulator, peroxide stress response regulator